jgi:hypothetical protein
MRQSLKKVAEVLDGLFGYSVSMGSLAHIKTVMANKYANTYRLLIRKIKNGDLVHVDETSVSIKGNKAYTWVFTNLDEVAYFYSDSREGQLLKDVLHKFKGVLISDFYSAYDSIRGGSGNSDSVLSGSLASPTPGRGGNREERGDEEDETQSWGDV